MTRHFIDIPRKAIEIERQIFSKWGYRESEDAFELFAELLWSHEFYSVLRGGSDVRSPGDVKTEVLASGTPVTVSKTGILKKDYGATTGLVAAAGCLRRRYRILQGRKLTKFLRQGSHRRGRPPIAILNFQDAGGR
jgi:hypothetical protein